MADDINTTTLLRPLTAATQIRRVKPTDPENERRSFEEQQRRRKKSKGSRNSSHDGDAVEVELHKAPSTGNQSDTGLSEKPRQKAEAQADATDKTIDIRV